MNGMADDFDDEAEDYGSEIQERGGGNKNPDFKMTGTKTAMNQLVKGSEEI